MGHRFNNYKERRMHEPTHAYAPFLTPEHADKCPGDTVARVSIALTGEWDSSPLNERWT